MTKNEQLLREAAQEALSQPAEGGEVCNVKSSAGLIRPGKVDSWVANHYTTPPSSQEQAQQPQFVRVVDGVPVITVTEHEHLMAQQPKPQPMTDEQIRPLCKQGWVFETVKQWVSVIEAHHGITSDKEK